MTLSMPRAREGGEQVLDGLDRHGFAGQSGLVLDPAQMRNGCGNLQTAQVAALKADAVISRRRFQRQRDFVAGMKSDSGAGDVTTKGALSVHDLM